MSTAIVTGSCGLIGSESVHRFHELGWDVIGIDNNMRMRFFGQEASTAWMMEKLSQLKGYRHLSIDIRDKEALEKAFKEAAGHIELVVHAAAQPSHDWAVRDPITDFTVNAQGTLNLLEAARKFAPYATFIYLSTNKVYGDTPNKLPLIELDTRYELPLDHEWYNGIPEKMSIDQCTHSLFGVSKASADLMVQEYGRYLGMHTVVFRGGCLTGPGHSGTELHGFLAYLMKCAATYRPYKIFGYKGKQVRDNIHSADLITALVFVAKRPPQPGKVYNIGGGRKVNCSMLEAIELCEAITGNKLQSTYLTENRLGDHIWWIGDLSGFKSDYPDWSPKHSIQMILEEIYESNRNRWLTGVV